MEQQLRIARPTNDLDRTIALYRDGLGFEVLGEFREHEGFDGAMLGRKGSPYHLEFTQETGVTVGPAPSQEHLLVFYIPEPETWEAACVRAENAGFLPVASHNPFWERKGKTFEDFEGYRVVFHNAHWPL